MTYTVLHNKKSLTKILDDQGNPMDFNITSNIVKDFFQFCTDHKNSIIIWCHEELLDRINQKVIEKELYHNRIMISFSTSGNYVIDKRIGYVDHTVFINVNREVLYPTWLMSSDVGAMHIESLLEFSELSNSINNFDEFLCTVAKLGQSEGLITRSVPELISDKSKVSIDQNADMNRLFRFVKKNYSIKWVLILFLNCFFYEKRFLLFQLINTSFQSRYKLKIELNEIKREKHKNNKSSDSFKVDVIIPTLKRKSYLYDVLKDLSNQTILPQKVIIIEQEANKEAKSELDYLNKEIWPFEIVHEFIHQLGACNARNLALSKVTNEWVFFADDDIRFESNLFEEVNYNIQKYHSNTCMISCLLEGEQVKSNIVVQSAMFGSGTSFVKSESLKGVNFKKEHEFGYGEDSDFGMQLRNNGTDILFFPSIKMTHLKAPTGGFRYEHKFPWSKEAMQPKPSPTVMAYWLKHSTKEQLLGYKSLLFILFYKEQKIKNLIKYISLMKKRWEISKYWALKMIDNEV